MSSGTPNRSPNQAPAAKTKAKTGTPRQTRAPFKAAGSSNSTRSASPKAGSPNRSRVTGSSGASTRTSPRSTRSSSDKSKSSSGSSGSSRSPTGASRNTRTGQVRGVQRATIAQAGGGASTQTNNTASSVSPAPNQGTQASTSQATATPDAASSSFYPSGQTAQAAGANQDSSGSSSKKHCKFVLRYESQLEKSTWVEIERKAAEMSPLINTMLNLSGEGTTKRIFIGEFVVDPNQNEKFMVIPLSNKAFENVKTLQRIKEWCEHHVNDQPWDPNSRYDDFEMDEWDLEDERLKEPISFWDWNFFVEITGRQRAEDSNWDPVKRGDFYDLMIGAYYLGLEGLVEAGGKFLCDQIKNKNMNAVRTLLNMAGPSNAPQHH